MPSVTVDQNQLSYLGLYARPALSLWGQGSKLLTGLYDAFEPLGVRLADFRAEAGSGTPAEEGILINLTSATYRFKFDRVEASVNNFNQANLDQFARVLSLGDHWLRQTVSNFSSHLLAYAAHLRLDGVDADSFLKSLGGREVTALGKARGTGFIFHAETEDASSVQLSIDHSIVVQSGLFFHLTWLLSQDQVDYSDLLARGKQLLFESGSELGLDFFKSNDA